MMECMATDLPDPVAPAISRWGILPRLAKWHLPDTPLPSDNRRDLSDS